MSEPKQAQILTTHDPWSYSDVQIAEMLLIHACLDRGRLEVITSPDAPCPVGPGGCERCTWEREHS